HQNERKKELTKTSEPHLRHRDSRRRIDSHHHSPSPLSPFSIPHHTAHLRSASLTPYLTLSLTNTDHNSPSPPLTDTHRCCLPRHQPIGHQNRSERKTLASPPLLRTRFYSNPSFQEVFTHHLVGLLRSHRSS
ncbi:hypothetical protein PIB30_110209, partial [Stylosanthes scabra]|nr:hypothetical protein [Stylosanthes scabra]